MESVVGIVTRLLVEDRENGKVMFLAEAEGPDGLREVKVTAFSVRLSAGDCVRAEGVWREDNYKGRKGRILEASQVRPDIPRTEEGCIRFLAGVFNEARHGVARDSIVRFLRVRGPAAVREAVENHGLVLGLSSAPDQFRAAILSDWTRKTGTRRALDMMAGAGWSEAAIGQVVKALPPEDIYSRLSSNPFIAAPVDGVGFDGADALAQKLGIAQNDARRVIAALEEAARATESSGSTWLPLRDAVSAARKKIPLSEDTLRDFALALPGTRGKASPLLTFPVPHGPKEDDTGISLSSTAVHEALVSLEVARVLREGPKGDPARIETAERALFSRPEFSRFDAVQRLAVSMAATEPLSVITGGPGTGKSTVMEAFVALEEALGRRVICLTAPTGKAAKRLSETTGREASTLQSLLGQQPPAQLGGRNTFRRNRDNPLPHGVTVVVDEASMLDAELAAALFSALPRDGRVVLVGDRNQLPSVGAGSVLADLLGARSRDRLIVPSVGLVRVYRQGKDSGIAKGAALIRDGRMPEMDAEGSAGVAFLDTDPALIADALEREVCETLPSQGFDPVRDVALLIPQYAGPFGVHEMNRRLSRRLNPGGERIPGLPERSQDGPVPRVGDKVMIRENTRLTSPDGATPVSVVNGDLGTVVGHDAVEGRRRILIRREEGDTVALPAQRWRQIPLAYALTVHKSQGSQYKAVVMPVADGQKTSRPLFYTGWTRAQSVLRVVGQDAAVRQAVAEDGDSRRRTMLGNHLSATPAAELAVDRRRDWEMAQVEATRMMEGGPPASRPAPLPTVAAPAPPKPVMPHVAVAQGPRPAFMKPARPAADPPPEPVAAPSPAIGAAHAGLGGAGRLPAFMERRRREATGSLGRSLPLGGVQAPPPPK